MSNRSAKYAVIGNPIAHSKSPQIHQAFARQTKQAIEYTRLLAEPDAFNSTVEEFFTQGGSGLNVTVPFKTQAFALCESTDQYATAAEAVNTLWRNENGAWVGSNTDGIGLCRDLSVNLDVKLRQYKILIIGAGGATQGIICPLFELQPEQIVISNRTMSKAEQLAQTYSTYGSISARSVDSNIDSTQHSPFDLIINATSAGLHGETLSLPSQIANEDTVCYDLVYAERDTPFMLWAKQNGCKRVFDGLGMLVEQAAESFYLWRGIRPETTPVLEQLRSGNLK